MGRGAKNKRKSSVHNCSSILTRVDGARERENARGVRAPRMGKQIAINARLLNMYKRAEWKSGIGNLSLALSQKKWKWNKITREKLKGMSYSGGVGGLF